jgi:hypothetical protein
MPTQRCKIPYHFFSLKLLIWKHDWKKSDIAIIPKEKKKAIKMEKWKNKYIFFLDFRNCLNTKGKKRPTKGKKKRKKERF